MNRIFIQNDTSRGLLEKVTALARATAAERKSKFCFDTSDFRGLLNEWRDKLIQYVEFSRPQDIFVVNTQGFGGEHFALLLKSLENPTVGEFWLYGRNRSDYPATVFSRCQLNILTSDEETNQMRELEDVLAKMKAGKYTDSAAHEVPSADSLMPYLKYLGHYDMSMGVAMVLMKSTFVDFLYMLDVANLTSFSTLMTFAEKLNDETVVFNLYEEWLAENKIFSEKALKVCSILRDPKIRAELATKTTLGKFFVPFLICYKMTKMK